MEIEEDSTDFPNGRIKQRHIDEKHVKQMRDKFNIRSVVRGFNGRKGIVGL